MTPGEIYELKRKNFIEKTKKHFEFLVSEYGFKEPEHFTREQANKSVIQDRIEYDRHDKKLVIQNSYHPVDYGFEINIINKESGETSMLNSVLKEKQNVEQSYLKSASGFLKNTYSNKIRVKK